LIDIPKEKAGAIFIS